MQICLHFQLDSVALEFEANIMFLLILVVKMVLFICFNLQQLSVLRGHLFFSSPPKRPMTFDFRFSSQILTITFLSFLNS